jgi:hypothetical protein
MRDWSSMPRPRRSSRSRPRVSPGATAFGPDSESCRSVRPRIPGAGRSRRWVSPARSCRVRARSRPPSRRTFRSPSWPRRPVLWLFFCCARTAIGSCRLRACRSWAHRCRCSWPTPTPPAQRCCSQRSFLPQASFGACDERSSSWSLPLRGWGSSWPYGGARGHRARPTPRRSSRLGARLPSPEPACSSSIASSNAQHRRVRKP